MRRRSLADTPTSWFSDRSRRGLFVTLRCPAICRPRRSLPVPVMPMRFAVPWCVFALPMVPAPRFSLLLRRHDHDHVPAFEQRRALHRAHVAHRLGQALQEPVAGLRIRHLAASEPHRYAHLVPLAEEIVHVFHFRLEVVLADLRREAHPFQVAAAVMRPAAPLTLLVLVLAVIHDPAHRRLGRRGDLDQVENRLLRPLQRVTHTHHAQLLAVGADHTDLLCADPVVHSWFRGDTRYLLSGIKKPGTAARAIPGRIYW